MQSNREPKALKSTRIKTVADDIKAEIFNAIRGANTVMIVETADGYAVHQWTPDSVFPAITYPTKRLAAARTLQLLGLGPVGPQTHPERVCIGFVEGDAQDAARAAEQGAK
jgi:hypothetical protein